MKKQDVFGVLQLAGGVTAILFFAGLVVPAVLLHKMPASYSLFGTPFHTTSIAGIPFAYKLQNILAAALGGAFGPMIAFVLASPRAETKKGSSEAAELVNKDAHSVPALNSVAAWYSHFVALGDEFADGLAEDPAMQVDVRFASGRTHERHIVKRGEKQAAVESIEVEKALKLEICDRRGLTAVAWRLRRKSVFGAGTQANHVPGQRV